MATTAEVKTRIILETNRDDMGSGGALETALTNAITDAIEFHADELFWFNRKTGTSNTVATVATVALPSGMRIPLQVAYNALPLAQVDLDTIEYRTDTGQPTQWAENEGTIQLWPIPAGVYALSVFGIADLGIPASGASNEWTTNALALTLARAKLILYRDYLRDNEGAVASALAEQEALAKLRRETRRRGKFGLKSDLPVTRSGFFGLFRG